jgi:hypothetical protein
MAVPASGGRINRGRLAVPEGAEMHSIRTPRGEGALFTVKRRRIQSYAAPSDGVIYDEDTGEKIDGYMSAEEKVYSYPQPPKTLWRRKKSPVIGGKEEWSKWNHNVYKCKNNEGHKHKDTSEGIYIEAKGTQPKGWPTTEDGRLYNDGSPDHDDDICMVVKIKRDKGDGKPRIAYVDYVNGEDADQWKGPFTLDTSLETILSRRYSRMGYRGARASSESESDTSSSSSSSSSSSDSQPDTHKVSGVEKRSEEHTSELQSRGVYI